MNKTALVTGASRGIGRAIAQRLAADGAEVIVHYAGNETAAKETVEAIEAAGGTAIAVQADFAKPGAVDTLLTAIGDRRLDILVNNAGIVGSGPIEAVEQDAFDRMFAVNVKAPFFLIQQALPRFNDGGRIITVSSSNTRVAMPMVIDYSMTKGAVETMTRTLAQHLGPRGITVNAVAPGPTDTDMMAMLKQVPEILAAIEGMSTFGRMGTPADIADVVAFLASDAARWVTGQVVDTSGGMWLGPRLG